MTSGWKQKIHWWRLRWQWYRQKLVLTVPPYFINIEPTGFCNLHCQICSYKQDRGKGYVDRDLALRVIENAAQFGVSEIRFFLAGEPLFHPHLGELISAARQRGLITHLHTNATILDEKRSALLLDNQLDILSLSFDGENAEEYESIRRGSDFQQTLNHVLTFLELKKQRGLDYPFTTLQVIKLYHPGDSMTPSLSPEFKQKFDHLPVDRFLTLYPFAWPGQDSQEFVRPSGKKRFPCLLLWQSLSLAWDGRILGCCGDLNGLVTLGNLHKDRLEDVWNNSAMIEMRRQHVLGHFEAIPLCRNCDVTYVRVHPALRDLKELVFGRWTPV